MRIEWEDEMVRKQQEHQPETCGTCAGSQPRLYWSQSASVTKRKRSESPLPAQPHSSPTPLTKFSATPLYSQSQVETSEPISKRMKPETIILEGKPWASDDERENLFSDSTQAEGISTPITRHQGAPITPVTASRPNNLPNNIADISDKDFDRLMKEQRSKAKENAARPAPVLEEDPVRCLYFIQIRHGLISV